MPVIKYSLHGRSLVGAVLIVCLLYACRQVPDPVNSTTGSKIVFVSNRDGNKDIYTVNSDGTTLLRLTENSAEDEWPVWSHDGGSIIYDTDFAQDRSYDFLCHECQWNGTHSLDR
jgi:hypothetical protein